MTLYLDASALVSLIVEESRSADLVAWLARYDNAVWVSDFGRTEFASAVARLSRDQRMTADQAVRAIAALDFWLGHNTQIVQLATADIEAAFGFVCRFELGLRAPDALHLAICRRLGLTLLSFDVRQSAAAQTLGISVADIRF